MAHKYPAISDGLFVSDKETELVVAKEEDNGDHVETVLIKKSSYIVNQDIKEEGMTIMHAAKTNTSLLEVNVQQGFWEDEDDEEEGELRERCHICGKKVVLLEKHIITNHLEEVECQMCHKKFSVDTFRSHLLLEHCHNKCNKCSLCEQNFVSNSSLEEHIKHVHLGQQEGSEISQHVDGKAVFNNEYTNCTECGKAITISSLEIHIKSVHNKIKQICKVCNDAFCSYAFTVHKRTAHTLGIPTNIVTPSGPNPKNKRPMYSRGEFKTKMEEYVNLKKKLRLVKKEEKKGFNDEQDDIAQGVGDHKEPKVGMDKETIQIGDKNFTFFVTTSPKVAQSPPKTALTGYFLFCQEEKLRMKKEGMLVLPRVLKCRWNILYPEERTKFESLAVENQERINMRKMYFREKRNQRENTSRI